MCVIRVLIQLQLDLNLTTFNTNCAVIYISIGSSIQFIKHSATGLDGIEKSAVISKRHQHVVFETEIVRHQFGYSVLNLFIYFKKFFIAYSNAYTTKVGKCYN